MSRGFGNSVLPPQQAREATILEKSVLRHFQDIADPRSTARSTHPLVSIITIAILAVLSGADGCVAIKTYGNAKQLWLETFLDLPCGIPTHDTFGRVLAALEPQELENCFLQWMKTITEKLDIKLIHIDGKEHNGSYDREDKLKSLHSVSAWSSEYGLSLAQAEVDSKSNEIKALPILLNLLDLKGATVTLDAMGTQFAIAQQIRKAGGDYILALKGSTVVMVKSQRVLWNKTTTAVRFYISSL